MTNIIITVMLFFSSLFYNLTDSTPEPQKEKKVEVNSISFAVNSGEELKTIDWEELRTVFDKTGLDKNIGLNFKVNLKGKGTKNLRTAFRVNGKVKDLDELIEKAQKGVNKLVIISNNYKRV